MAGWKSRGRPSTTLTEHDLTEQELLVEILRHVRGQAYAVYALLALAVLGVILGFLVGIIAAGS